MAYHDWSDDTFDWKGLDDCCDIIYEFCWKYGRFSGQIKEKFGELRFYCHFGLSLHQLLFPKYCWRYHDFFIKYKWLINFDNYVFIPFCSKIGLTKLWVNWQKFIYSTAYWKAMKKHPHLREEILNGADYPEYIKNATRIEETETERITHILGWHGETVGKWISTKH